MKDGRIEAAKTACKDAGTALAAADASWRGAVGMMPRLDALDAVAAAERTCASTKEVLRRLELAASRAEAA